MSLMKNQRLLADFKIAAVSLKSAKRKKAVELHENLVKAMDDVCLYSPTQSKWQNQFRKTMGPDVLERVTYFLVALSDKCLTILPHMRRTF